MKKAASSQRQTLEKDEQIAEGNSASLINNFVFNLKDYLNKPLALNTNSKIAKSSRYKAN